MRKNTIRLLRDFFDYLEVLKLSEREMYFAYRVFARNFDPYINIHRKKNSGGRTRLISVPNAELSVIQRKILSRLEKIYEESPSAEKIISTSAHAYVKGRSNATAAEQHLGMIWGVKIDLERFFDHISEEHVFSSLRRIELEEEARYISKLVTRLPSNYPKDLPPKYSRMSRTVFGPISWPTENTELSWFSKLLIDIVISKKIKGKNKLSKSPDKLFLEIIPPKKLPRVFPTKYNNEIEPPDFKKMELDFLFGTLRKFFRLIEGRDDTLRLHQSMQRSRTTLRSRLLSKYTNRHHYSVLPNQSSQKYYAVRPEQFRDRIRLGFLPQGACTSGFISNIVMAPFDAVLTEFCEENGLTYTRYSDDIMISCKNRNFSRDRALQIVSFTQKLSEFNGFTLNKKKTRILGPGSKKQVLGTLVDGPELRLGRLERERIEKMIYLISKFGDYWMDQAPGKHLLNTSHYLEGKRLGSRRYPLTPSSPDDSLAGWLSYCNRVDRNFLRKINKQLIDGKWEFKDGKTLQHLISMTNKLLRSSKPESTKPQAQKTERKVHWNRQLTEDNPSTEEPF